MDDDFFGFGKLESTNIPPSFHSRRQLKNEDYGVQQKSDIFEENFFSGLDHHHQKEKHNENKGPVKEKIKDFFEEHFTKKADYDVNRQYINELNMEQIDIDPENEPNAQRQGMKLLWEQVKPVWKLDKEELVELMASRVIHETDDFIALDKPYQMAYSGAQKDQAQLDGILMLLKKRIAPKTDRLHLITSLDKTCSGVILFAKSKEKQQEFKALLAQGNFYFRFRCLCRNFPSEEKVRISIPLIKVIKGRNFKLCPLLGNARNNEQLYHLNTDCKLINENRKAQICLIDAFTRQGMANLVRSHLYYGLDCPVIGDEKYARTSVPEEWILKKVINQHAMDALEIRKNDIKKLPMFLHLAEIHVPKAGTGSFTVVKAGMPPFFLYALKKLSLLRK